MMDSDNTLVDLVDDLLVSLIHRLAGASQYNAVVDHLSDALSILRADRAAEDIGTYYLNGNGNPVPVRRIEVGLCGEQAEFAAWLQEKLPDVDVTIGSSTRDYVNGLWTEYIPAASDLIDEYWEEYRTTS